MGLPTGGPDLSIVLGLQKASSSGSLSLNTLGRVLPQSDMPYFAESPWEALPSLGTGWGFRCMKSERKGGRTNWDYFVN